MADLKKSEKLAAQGKHAEAFKEAAKVARQALKDMEKSAKKLK